jgi:hypothetical protein
MGYYFRKGFDGLRVEGESGSRLYRGRTDETCGGNIMCTIAIVEVE